jgi:hypothetical protein
VKLVPAIKPAGWLATTLLFGAPAVIFALLFIGWDQSLFCHHTSPSCIFHLSLILPLSLMFIAALVGAALDAGSLSGKSLAERLRLSAPHGTVWLWATVPSGFVFGGTRADLVAVAASWLALWRSQRDANA